MPPFPRPVPAEPRHAAILGGGREIATAGGFTLVEILITIAFITLVSTVAVPNLLRSRAASNEDAAIATLRAIAEAQRAFRDARIVDRDGDGQGEFGTLAELAGHRPAIGRRQALAPPPLRAALGEVDESGRALRDGYLFALHLPGPAGVGLAEQASSRASVDPDLAEAHWTCVAWPLRQGESGAHAFFVNEEREIRRNRSARYSGTLRVPPAGAALAGTASPGQVAGGLLAGERPAADGQVWLATR